jgi:IS5 family transposase
MQPPTWRPPVELSIREQRIRRGIRRAKLFVFLREQRHELFTDSFQAELARVYKASPLGQPPTPPAQLALATILQAYTGVSDDEVIEACVMDRRWQYVLDCLDCERAPFSKGTLVGFRQRLIAAELDRRLVERTIELAQQRAGFSPRALRAALDSSPLWGAGRVEDTYNLLGHALRKALGVIARQQGRGLAELAVEAGAACVGGAPSLKAALDLDWDDPTARTQALGVVLGALGAVEQWLPTGVGGRDAPAARASLATAQQVVAQDVTTSETGAPVLREGVAKDRRISVEDAQMRHGRKSRSRLFDGFKRHICHDLDTDLIRAVGVTAANVPEATVTDAILEDLAEQGIVLACQLPAPVSESAAAMAGGRESALAEMHIDRAYLSSRLVRDRPPELRIACKAWPVHNGEHFPKTAFVLDWEQQTIRCPNDVVLPLRVGGTIHFPAATCTTCPLQARCTSSATGRSVSIHPDERLLAELRQRQLTPAGRAQLRERVAVEHDLAHIGHWQGARARYRGLRKNRFELRRCAVVHNLHVIARQLPLAQEAA